ncbi:response regulator [Sphingomonas sp.]|uniref:response regulator n=1 Tax=Sphingomonas sp. TaxID=28214 RepID=UPI0035BC41BA
MTLPSRPGRRVIIVDDSRTIQALLDNAFSARSGFSVVGFSSDAQSAVEMIRRLMPDIVTIDLCMPYIDGAALLDLIADLRGVCKIVVSDQSTNNLLLTAKLEAAGASLCLSKTELASNPDAFFAKITSACDAAQAKRRDRLGINRKSAQIGAKPECGRTGNASFGFPVPMDEKLRLETLRRKQLANAVRERQFDLVTKHVAEATGFPVCLPTFIDRDTQWIKSAYGFGEDSMPRGQAFCNYTISQGGSFVVSNAASDERFANNPLVTGAPHIHAYMGHPITIGDGTRIGALCVVDTRYRAPSNAVLRHLAGMSDILGEMIDLRPTLAA